MAAIRNGAFCNKPTSSTQVCIVAHCPPCPFTRATRVHAKEPFPGSFQIQNCVDFWRRWHLAARTLSALLGASKIGSGGFQARSVLAFQDFPYENFKWYDFGLFAVLALIALLIIKLGDNNLSTLRFLLLGILITSFFEYLGFVFAFSLIIYSRSNKGENNQAPKNGLSQGAVIMFGSCIWLGFIATYHQLIQSLWPKFFPGEKEQATQHILDVFWALQHPIENLTSNPSILFQIALVLFQSAVLAMVTGLITRISLKPIQVEPKFINAFKSVNLAMTVVIFVTIFMAYGVKIQAGEHARQTMGLQISLFLYIFIKIASNKKSLAKSI